MPFMSTNWPIPCRSSRSLSLLHKPVGYVSGQPEDGHASAASLLGSRSHWRGDKARMRFLPRQLRGLAPAGRSTSISLACWC